MTKSSNLAHTLALALGILGATPALAGYVEPQLVARPLTVPHKVVYHFNTKDAPRLHNLLGNIQNHLKSTEGQAEIHLVIHNDAVWLLQDPTPEIRKRLDELRERNVNINVCNTSLKGRDIDWHSLYGVKESDLVASGVATVADLQMRGYAYLKP